MRYLVDTCVLSELARKIPSPQVLACMTMVTRNVKDFQFDGLTVVNPFEEQSAQSAVEK